VNGEGGRLMGGKALSRMLFPHELLHTISVAFERDSRQVAHVRDLE
jgi:hypothetical protein